VEHGFEVSGLLEIEKVRELDDECTLDKRAVTRVSTVVVHDVQIAQWMVNDVETDVRSELMRIGIVLEEPIQKYARRKPVQDARAGEGRFKRPIGQRYAIVRGVQVDIQPVIRPPI